MRNTFLGGAMLAAIVAGILVVAVAAAQTSSPTPTPTATGTPSSLADRFKEELAKQLNISVDQLNTALTNTDVNLIDQAVADGKLTQTEADQLKSRINNDNNLHPFAGVRGAIGKGLKAGLVDESAKVLNVDSSVITDGLKNGDTLATIANSNGMSTSDFESKLLTQVKSDLDAKVSSGAITQAQADKIYNGLSNNIDTIVNHTPGNGGFGHFRGRGHGSWFGGQDNDNNGSGGSSTPAPSSTGTSTTF